jgi:hypothetical protein
MKLLHAITCWKIIACDVLMSNCWWIVIGACDYMLLPKVLVCGMAIISDAATLQVSDQAVIRDSGCRYASLMIEYHIRLCLANSQMRDFRFCDKSLDASVTKCSDIVNWVLLHPKLLIVLAFLIHSFCYASTYILSICIAKSMNLEKPKQLIHGVFMSLKTWFYFLHVWTLSHANVQDL